MIAIPAAFTVPTGEAHWHLLQRARAVEASAYVVAAAQVGEHADGRRTYGHSLVVDPWGEVVLDMGGETPGVGFAEIDPARIAEVRAPAAQPCQPPRRSPTSSSTMIVFDLACARRPPLRRLVRLVGGLRRPAGARAGRLPAVRLDRRRKAPMAPAVAAQGQSRDAPRRRPAKQSVRRASCRPRSPRRCRR